MNILITGGAGFIGVNLSLKLIEKGHQVTVLDNLSPQIHGKSPEVDSYLYKMLLGKVKFIKGSVTCKNDWLNALEGQDIVVHLAAETGTGQSMYLIHKYVDVNVNGTAILLDLLSNNKESLKVKKLIVASSRAIYGEGKYLSKTNGIVYPTHRKPEDLNNGNFDLMDDDGKTPLGLLSTDEESKIHPSSVYGITKQNQEQMVMTVGPSLGINCVSFRYQNVFGPGQSLKNPYTGILSIFSTLIFNKKELNIFEDGNESRDFVFIEDVVEATIFGIENDAANNEVFNVGSGISTKVIDVAKSLIRNYGIEVPIKISGNYRVGDIRHNYADISKIESKLGFACKFTFDEGLKLFTDWVKEQNIESDDYENSINEMKLKGLFK